MFSVSTIGRFGRGLLAVTVFGLGLSACGSSGSPGSAFNPTASCVPSDPSTASNCGSVLIALTDAEGDFVSYTVDILSISLERANGTRVEMLPATTRVDFAQLTELSELVSATTLAPGDIVGGRIRLDYGDAEIFVEAGGDIVAAEVYANESDTTPLGVAELDISLANSEHLIVTRGRTAFLSIDFDLAASHDVDSSMTPVRVIAEPYLVAEVQPLEEKELRVRGGLIDVDLGASSYDIRVRPWHHRSGDHGRFTVHTTSSTKFEIGDGSFTGEDGLKALADLPQGSLTVAFGTLNLNDRHFTAKIVHAGDSVGGDRFTAIYGNIVARSADQLVVKGAFAVRNDRRAHFHRTVLIDVGPDTHVSRLGDAATSLDQLDLSVGQRIVAFGELANPQVDNSNPLGPDVALILDATEGRVRMHVTRLHGTVNSYLPGQINMQLRGIDRLGIDLFDFSGTGILPIEDADPDDYEVATSTLALDALEIGQPARVLGFVTRFGEAPPDFSGRTIVGPRDIPAALGIGWMESGTNAPFSVMLPDSLVLDLDNPSIGLRHHMKVGLRLVDLFDLPASPAIIPSDARGRYSIWEPGHVEIFAAFPDFVDELALRLGAADNARTLYAYGIYDASGNSLTTRHVVVHMKPAE